MIKIIHIGSIVLCIFSTILFVFSGFYMNRDADAYGPEIYMEETEIEVSISATEEDILQGITAIDKKDGDVSDSLLVESMSLFTESGKRKVTIDAFDNNHNVTKTERVIRYTDYTSPRIVLSDALRAPLNNVDLLMDCITVEDCLEGDVTDSLQITPVEDISSITLPGEYAMKLMVSNSVGDVVEIPITVELYDYSQDAGKAKAVLSDYLIYTKVGQKIDPQKYLIGVEMRSIDYIWADAAPGALIPYTKNQFVIQNNVDINTPGVYEVIYSLEDTSGNLTNIRQIVIVEE